MKAFAFIYNGFILGMLFSLLAFQNEWLEMRMNIGLIIFITMAISLITYGVLTYLKKDIYHKKLKVFASCALIFSFLISLLVVGAKRLATLPASILREGLNMTYISFNTMNIIILSITIVGLAIILLFTPKERK